MGASSLSFWEDISTTASRSGSSVSSASSGSSGSSASSGSSGSSGSSPVASSPVALGAGRATRFRRCGPSLSSSNGAARFLLRDVQGISHTSSSDMPSSASSATACGLLVIRGTGRPRTTSLVFPLSLRLLLSLVVEGGDDAEWIEDVVPSVVRLNRIFIGRAKILFFNPLSVELYRA